MRNPLLVVVTCALPTALSLTVPLRIHGLSVSDSGFIALLSDRSRGRLLPLRVADDRERASSTEALTLLQLLQGIDLGGSFPPEALQAYCNGDDTATLQHVVVSAPDCFSLAVKAQGSDVRLTACRSPFEAVAFSMRYDVPLMMEANVLERDAFDATECESRYPSAFTAMDAAQQRTAITRRMACLPIDEPMAPLTAGKSALDVTAFDVAALRTAVDKCAPTPPPVEEGLNANAPPPDMLLRVLAMAERKGDLAAVEQIKRKIEVEQLKRDLKGRTG